MNRMKEVMKEICDKQISEENYYSILEKIFDHLSLHEAEAPNLRKESIRRIIDSELEDVK